MRILVTGAAGYVGWAVVHELVAGGDEVVALLHHQSAAFPAGVEERWADLLDRASAASAVRDVEAVCHLAGITEVRRSLQHPALYYRTNVGSTLNLLEAMAEESARTSVPAGFVLASTCQVYGIPEEQPIIESAPLQDINPYAASKAACEQLLGWQAKTGAVGATTLRIFNAAGSAAGHGDLNLSRIIPKVVAVAAGAAREVEINGDGTAVRDFVAVRDLARAFSLAVHSSPPGSHAVYNVGATAASVTDVVAAAERVTGQRIAVRHRPAHGAETPVLTADTAAIRCALGWQPELSGLEQLVRDQWSAATAGE